MAYGCGDGACYVLLTTTYDVLMVQLVNVHVPVCSFT